MSKDKERFSARTHAETLEEIDDYAERRNLNRSQAVERIVNQWSDLTDSGEVHPELVKARRAATNSPLEEAKEKNVEYAIAGAAFYLIYYLVGVPSFIAPVLLFVVASCAFAAVAGSFVMIAEWLGVRSSSETAEDIEVEA
jgi:hypothetical protein